MRFYGIVDEIKPEHPSGLYSIRSNEGGFLEKFQIKKLKRFLNGIKEEGKIKTVLSSLVVNPFLGLGYISYRFVTESEDFKITIKTKDKKEEEKKIIFTKDSVDGNYQIIKFDPEFFYGLFDNFYCQKTAFKKLIDSKGGSEFLILEKKSLLNSSHHGGVNGIFTTGIYCQHPKKPEILIPLANFSEIIKSLILEEIINSFQLLGAKSIIVEDNYELVGGSKLKIPTQGKGEFKSGLKKDILRKKSYAKDIFKKDLCLERLTFLPDYPNIMNIIDGRINGNQLTDETTETIDLSANLDIDVLNLFESQVNFKYKRNWSFKVEFYDKNDLKRE
ncbi:MAG: hypothetical protein ACQEW9_16265 [Bacteroidota bacterium]